MIELIVVASVFVVFVVPVVRWTWLAGSAEEVERRRIRDAVHLAYRVAEREALQKQSECQHLNIMLLPYSGGGKCRDCGASE